MKELIYSFISYDFKFPLCYMLWGALHEFTHILAATCCECRTMCDGFRWANLLSAFLFRHVSIDTSACTPTDLWKIQHSAWLVSVVAALAMSTRLTGRRELSTRSAVISAWIVALEGISTDLLQLRTLPGISNVPYEASRALYFCGNFGIILLHHSWLSSHGGPALDVLQRMIQVTMM